MINHINSYGRKKLNECSPYAVFRFLYGDDIFKKLGAELIPANEVILNPSLLRKRNKRNRYYCKGNTKIVN